MSWKKSSDSRLVQWVGGKFNFIVYLNRDEEPCCALSLTDDAKLEMQRSMTVMSLEEMAKEATVLMRDMMTEMVKSLNVEIMEEVMGA